jgi:hypothetical protein
VIFNDDISFSGGSFNGGSNSASVEFRGSATQDITGDFTGANSFYRLRIFGSGIRLNNPIEIDDRLTLDNGLIDGNGNTVSLGSTVTVSPSANGQSNSYVNGRVLKTITSVGGSFTFPIGSASQWRPAKVQNVSLGGLTWEAEYFQVSALNEALVDNLDPTDPLAIATVSNAEYWKISDGNGTPSGATANIGLSWGVESDVSFFKSEREELQILAWNDGVSSWDNYGGFNFSSGHSFSRGSFESISVFDFSSASENIMTLGSSDIANPLPVELISFKALALKTTVKLTWETATELNNDFFTILRSKDGVNFNELAWITGAGNSSSKLEYTYIDERPYQGLGYYKLLQTDFDGTQEDLGTVLVRMDNSHTTLLISSYPNPSHGEVITVSISGINRNERSELFVFDQFGKMVYTRQVMADEQGFIDHEIANSELPANGVYIIKIITEKGPLQNKHIKY